MRALACLLLAPLAAQTVVPRGGQRGTELTVRYVLGGVKDTVGVLQFRPGIDIRSIEEPQPNRVMLRVAIADDCPLGEHPWLLHTKHGITRLVTFQVGPLPQANEKEPNDRREQAQPVARNTTIEGSLSGPDVDWYAIEIDEPERWTFEVQGVRLGERQLDPYLELFDGEGRRLAVADDSVLGRLDPILSYAFDAPGSYRLAVRDAGYNARRFSRYRLHAGTFPRPLGLVPSGGQPGSTFDARWLGDEDHVETVAIPTDAAVFYTHFPSCDGAVAPTGLPLRVTQLADVVESAASKQAVHPPRVALHGVVAREREIDRFKFSAKQGRTYTVRSVSRVLRSPIDTVLQIRDAKDKVLQSNDDNRRPDSQLRFRAPADGVYTLIVRDFLRRGGERFFYRIEIEPARGMVTSREAVPGRRAEDFGVAVPRGGRVATVFATTGLDPKAEIALAFEGLPDGVTVESAPVTAGTSLVPVVFAAAAEAPLAASATEVVATSAREPKRRDAGFRHQVPLVRVENNQIYQTTTMERYPVAVTQPAPFSIELEAPRVPIIRASPMALQVTVNRRDGFDGAVRLQLLWTPPGLSAGRTNVPGNRDRGSIPLNARGNARLGTWQIVVLGYATVDGVQRRVSSALADLEVQAPWVTAKIGRARGEQGQTLELPIELEHQRAFDGEVELELLRLPAGVTTTKSVIHHGTEAVALPLTVAAKAPPGRHRRHYLRLRIPTAGGEVIHHLFGGEVRIDRPLPEHLKNRERKSP